LSEKCIKFISKAEEKFTFSKVHNRKYLFSDIEADKNSAHFLRESLYGL